MTELRSWWVPVGPHAGMNLAELWLIGEFWRSAKAWFALRVVERAAGDPTLSTTRSANPRPSPIDGPRFAHNSANRVIA